MIMPFVVLLSTTEMNNGFVNLKQKRRIKHTVTLLVAIAILIAMIIVTGVLYVFQLPPKNRKLTANDANLLQDEDTWKREVHAVFAINLVGPKNTRVRRSIENVKRFTLEVIRSLLITYYDSDAQFVIQSYSVTGNTTISDLCDAECTMKHINEIDQEPTFTSENPNQTDAVWQYYRYSLGKKPSLYILFVADRASYRDDALFAKDMEESSRALRETKLIERTETVLVDDINATDYFLYSIISDGTSASETASLINDRLISHYRNNDEMSASAGISSVIDSQENTAHIKSTNDEDDNSIDVQTIMATSTTAYRLNTDTIGQVIAPSSSSSTAQSNQLNMDEVSSRDISLSSLDNVHSRETFHEKEFTAVDIFDATKVTIPTEVSTDRTTSDSSGTDYTTSDSAETGSISISVSAGANHATSDSSGTEKTAFMVPPFLWVGNVNENSFGEGSRDGRKTTDAMNRLTSVNEISSSITDESMLTRSTEYVTKASHTISEESASEDVANINSTVTVAGMLSESEIHQLETTETSRNTYSDFSSSKTTLSSLENKAMSEMGAIVDTDSGTVHVEYHSTIHYDGMKNLLSSPSSVTVSTSSAERSGIDERNDNSVSNKAISTIATNIKDEEMFKESGSYLDSIKSSTVIVPLLFSNLPVMDDESLPVTESFTSTRASKSNVDSVDGKVEMDLMYPSTTSTMPQSDAVNLAYFSKNFAPAPTLTSTKMLSSFGTDIPDDNDARIRSTTESHSTEVTTVESGSMAINNVTSILEISKTGSEDSAFIQEGLLSNRNMKQFMFEGNDSLLSTAESLATASTTTEIPPKNTTDSSEMLSKALSTSTDKKLSVTMSELLNGDNFKHSIAITNNYFAFSQTKTTSSSSESMNRLFADSELITATETASAGETSTLDAGSGKNHPLISGINSTLIATTGDTFTGASHQESSDTKQILSNLTVANPTMAGLFGSMESSTITIQNTNGAGNEIPNSITVADNELKDTTLSAKIPMAIFNITIPSSVFDVKFSSYINRPSIDYNYLLMDEVDYREDEGTNVPSSRIASSTDVEIAFLDDASTNTNETYNDLYLYDDHSLTLTNGSALKNFKTTNVTLTKIPEKHFLPENVSPVVQSNSFVPFDGITEEDRSSVSSVNIANALHFLNAGTRPLETAILDGTLENAVISTALPNFNEFTEKVPDEHDSITAKKAPVRTASSLTDPIKFDLIGQQTNEQFTDADKGEQMIRLTTSLNNAENERSLEYVTATRASEIEEVAFLNISRRKIIHQTSTVLKAEKLTGNDSLTLTSAPRSSTIKPDERNMMENASSFDQISVQEENTTIVFSDLQPQTVDSIAVSSDYEASFSDKESLKLASAANVTSSTDKLPLSTLSSSVIPENSSLQRF